MPMAMHMPDWAQEEEGEEESEDSRSESEEEAQMEVQSPDIQDLLSAHLDEIGEAVGMPLGHNPFPVAYIFTCHY
jgi:hypothetical protein